MTPNKSCTGSTVQRHMFGARRGNRGERSGGGGRWGQRRFERVEVLWDAVALVLLEAVAGAVLRQRAHQAVARHLGDDGGRGDRQHDAVAADHGLAVARRVKPVTAVDERVPRRLAAARSTARFSAQSEARRILSRSIARGRRRRPRPGAVAQILSNSLFALLRRRALGIVDAARDAVGVEDHGRSHHRAGEWPAAGFVAAGDRPDAALDQRALAAEAWGRDGDDAFLAGALLPALAQALASTLAAVASSQPPCWAQPFGRFVGGLAP